MVLFFDFVLQILVFYICKFVHFKVEKREADSTTTSDLDETISYSDNSSDSGATNNMLVFR